MFVKPAEGRAVHWPGTRRLLAAEGAEVPLSTFWLLCLRNGDVVESKDEPVEAGHESAHETEEHAS